MLILWFSRPVRPPALATSKIFCGIQVAWIKADAKAILAIHEHVITNNGRLSVTHNDYNTWTLNIKSVKMEDRGQYKKKKNITLIFLSIIMEYFLFQIK